MPKPALSSRPGTPRAKRKGDLRQSDADLLALAQLARTQRIAQNLTQADLAGLSGTGVRFIVELEHAKPTLQLGKVARVFATLGLTLTVSKHTPQRAPPDSEMP